jgi:hypothetical protein
MSGGQKLLVSRRPVGQDFSNASKAAIDFSVKDVGLPGVLVSRSLGLRREGQASIEKARPPSRSSQMSWKPGGQGLFM